MLVKAALNGMWPSRYFSRLPIWCLQASFQNICICFWDFFISLKKRNMWGTDVSIDPFSSCIVLMECFAFQTPCDLTCYNNLCLDLHMIVPFIATGIWARINPCRVPTRTLVMCKYRRCSICESKQFRSLFSLCFFHNGIIAWDHRSQERMNLKCYPGYW